MRDSVGFVKRLKGKYDLVILLVEKNLMVGAKQWRKYMSKRRLGKSREEKIKALHKRDPIYRVKSLIKSMQYYAENDATLSLFNDWKPFPSYIGEPVHFRRYENLQENGAD